MPLIWKLWGTLDCKLKTNGCKGVIVCCGGSSKFYEAKPQPRTRVLIISHALRHIPRIVDDRLCLFMGGKQGHSHNL
jgi:hypothetical protein